MWLAFCRFPLHRLKLSRFCLSPASLIGPVGSGETMPPERGVMRIRSAFITLSCHREAAQRFLPSDPRHSIDFARIYIYWALPKKPRLSAAILQLHFCRQSRRHPLIVTFFVWQRFDALPTDLEQHRIDTSDDGWSWTEQPVSLKAACGHPTHDLNHAYAARRTADAESFVHLLEHWNLIKSACPDRIWLAESPKSRAA